MYSMSKRLKQAQIKAIFPKDRLSVCVYLITKSTRQNQLCDWLQLWFEQTDRKRINNFHGIWQIQLLISVKLMETSTKFHRFIPPMVASNADKLPYNSLYPVFCSCFACLFCLVFQCG